MAELTPDQLQAKIASLEAEIKKLSEENKALKDENKDAIVEHKKLQDKLANANADLKDVAKKPSFTHKSTKYEINLPSGKCILPGVGEISVKEILQSDELQAKLVEMKAGFITAKKSK